jgi:hypothetical protein
LRYYFKIFIVVFFLNKKGVFNMHVILDTNILHQEGLISRNMQRLERMAKTGRLKVCVPNLVLREFVTRKISDSLEVLSKSQPIIHELPRKLPGSVVAEVAIKMAELNAIFEAEVEKDYNKAVAEWVERLHVEVLDFGSGTAERVFADYFAGEGAFRARKKRDDIPDSFIAYSILPVLQRDGHIAVIVKDGVLKSYFRTIDGPDVFDSLTDYFEAQPFKRLVEEIDISTRNVEEIKSLFSSPSVSSQFVDFIKHDKDGLAYVYVEEDSIGGVEEIGMDVLSVSINGTRPEHITEVAVGEVDFVDAGFFSVAIEITAYADVHYVASYMDYVALQPPRNTEVHMSSMDGEGWADLGEVRKVYLRGFLQIRFGSQWTVKDIEPHLRYLKSENSAIGLELEINSARLI